jgi:hypothetical protein
MRCDTPMSQTVHTKKARFRALNAFGGRMWEENGRLQKNPSQKSRSWYGRLVRKQAKQKKPLPCGNGFIMCDS